MNNKTAIKNKLPVYLYTILSISSLIFGVFLIIFSLNIKTVKKVPVLSYAENSSIDYNVYLKQNDYFKEPFLKKDNQYIASIIDYIDIFYDYSFNCSKNINAEFNYKIVATLKAKHNTSSDVKNDIWTNDYILKEVKVEIIENEKTFSIKENIKINYQTYNNIINNFKNDYMLPVSSELEVKLLIEVNGEYVPINKVFEDNSIVSLVIPLSQQTINIKTDYQNVNEKDVLNQEKVGRFKNIYIFIIGILITLISVYMIIYLLLKIIKEVKKQTIYIKTIKKILHDYSDIIVEVKKAPTIPKKNASEVSNFEELVNAQVEIKSPIIFGEVVKNEEGIFALRDKDYYYYYEIKSSDLNQNKERK